MLRTPCRTILVGFLIMVGVFLGKPSGVSAAKAGVQDRVNSMRGDLLRAVDNFQSRLDTPKADATCRTYTFMGYYALAAGLDAKIAQDFISRAMARQEMDPDSPRFGDVPWQMFANDMNDQNSVEFTFETVGPILLRYSDKLSPEFRKQLIAHAVASIPALRRHKVPVSYTNIYVMKTVNLILLGEAIGDSSAVADGRAQLDTWIDYTRTHGISEYASPTYAEVQIDCLLNGYRCTRLPDVKLKLAAALDYLWSDAAARFFAPGNVMAGAHSREYDFLRGTGTIGWLYWIAGLADAPPVRTLFADGYATYVNEVENGYRPSNEILGLAKLNERIVKSRWDQRPGADTYLYVTPDFAVGSSSAYYAAQNRELAVDLGDGRPSKPVAITVSADVLDNPYGTAMVRDRSGHNKPIRIHTDTASVQDRSTVLALFNIPPEATKTPVHSIATNILFPLMADRIALDGKTVQFPPEAMGNPPPSAIEQLQSWSIPAHRDDVLGIRYGNAGVAVRIFEADGTRGVDPELELKCDGFSGGAGRLVAYHYRGESRALKEKMIRAGVAVICRRCGNDEQFDSLLRDAKAALIDQSLDDDVWRVRLTEPGDRQNPKSVLVSLDLATGRPADRRVDGADYVVDRLSVNGRDLAAEILDPLNDGSVGHESGVSSVEK
jgi:hypothetical protein